MSLREMVIVTKDDAVDFVRKYQLARKEAKIRGLDIYRPDVDGSLRLSFDKYWEPFIGESLSLNKPIQRHYIEHTEVTLRIVAALKRLPSRLYNGGRVFFSEKCVSVKQEKDKITIIDWKLVDTNSISLANIRALSLLRSELQR